MKGRGRGVGPRLPREAAELDREDAEEVTARAPGPPDPLVAARLRLTLSDAEIRCPRKGGAVIGTGRCDQMWAERPWDCQAKACTRAPSTPVPPPPEAAPPPVEPARRPAPRPAPRPVRPALAAVRAARAAAPPTVPGPYAERTEAVPPTAATTSAPVRTDLHHCAPTTTTTQEPAMPPKKPKPYHCHACKKEGHTARWSGCPARATTPATRPAAASPSSAAVAPVPTLPSPAPTDTSTDTSTELARLRWAIEGAAAGHITLAELKQFARGS